MPRAPPRRATPPPWPAPPPRLRRWWMARARRPGSGSLPLSCANILGSGRKTWWLCLRPRWHAARCLAPRRSSPPPAVVPAAAASAAAAAAAVRSRPPSPRHGRASCRTAPGTCRCAVRRWQLGGSSSSWQEAGWQRRRTRPCWAAWCSRRSCAGRRRRGRHGPRCCRRHSPRACQAAGCSQPRRRHACSSAGRHRRRAAAWRGWLRAARRLCRRRRRQRHCPLTSPWGPSHSARRRRRTQTGVRGSRRRSPRGWRPGHRRQGAGSTHMYTLLLRRRWGSGYQMAVLLRYHRRWRLRSGRRHRASGRCAPRRAGRASHLPCLRLAPRSSSSGGGGKSSLLWQQQRRLPRHP